MIESQTVDNIEADQQIKESLKLIKKTLRRISLVLLVLFATVGLFAQGAAESLRYAGKSVILHSNDVHGAIAGYAYIAQLEDEFKDMGANVIMVDAGDFSQGTVYVSTSKGLDAITMMNAAGYDIATLGNHEFDYGYPQLQENLEKAEFEIVCADIFDSDGNPIYDSGVIMNSGGLKIGFFGLDTPEAQTKANPALIKGLVFPAGAELYEVTQNIVDALKEKGAQVVIGLVHLGVDAASAPNRSLDVYANTTGIDFLIDGHSHTVMTSGENGEPIQSTGTAFEYIGVIVIDNESGQIEENYLLPVGKDESGVPVNAIDTKPSVSAAAQEIMDRVNGEYNIVFAQSLVDLNGERESNRTEETNLGSLIADAMLWTITKDEGSLSVPVDHAFAINNGGGIRASIAAGSVTKKDINTVLPFSNTLAVVYVTGAEILEAFEASTFCTPGSIGGFPQVSGIEFTIDTTKPYDAADETYPASTYYGPKSINRVTIENVNGQPFDLDATYAVITNNFVAAGGDTYHAFAEASNQYDTGIQLDEAVMDYITTELGGTIGEEYASPFGRIHVIK